MRETDTNQKFPGRLPARGWSSWASNGVEEPTDESGGILGFPVLSVIIGVTLVMLMQKTRILSKHVW
ncbi:hypothetical protein DRO27_02725 [Candidatus Bathyarchaeota archaeon]|nr:MAG: hypothetical protein DRO27_02725 [Candidatus Bathyarchaeota archaeon]